MRLRTLASVLLIPLASNTALAQAGSETNQSVATISFNSAVLQTAESRKALEGLQTRFAPRQAHLEALSKEVEALRGQLAGKTPINDTERSAKEQTLNSKDRQMQREAEDFKNDSEGAAQQVFQVVAQKVYAFLQTYAVRQGFNLVVERGTDSSPAVWYARKGLDITEQVTKAYDSLNATPSSPHSAAPSDSLPSPPTPH